MEGNVFSNCNSLTKLFLLCSTPPYIWYGDYLGGNFYSTFSREQYGDLNVYVPEGSLNAYQESERWKKFWNLAEGDPTGINQITTDNDAPSTIYDLKGNKLTSPKRGINVINGKKIVVE